jgi:hypothetical protein
VFVTVDAAIQIGIVKLVSMLPKASTKNAVAQDVPLLVYDQISSSPKITIAS